MANGEKRRSILRRNIHIYFCIHRLKGTSHVEGTAIGSQIFLFSNNYPFYIFHDMLNSSLFLVGCWKNQNIHTVCFFLLVAGSRTIFYIICTFFLNHKMLNLSKKGKEQDTNLTYYFIKVYSVRQERGTTQKENFIFKLWKYNALKIQNKSMNSVLQRTIMDT